MSALLIQNLDQFLDSLNYIETGIFTYEEIINSAEITSGDLKEDQISWSESHVTQNKVHANSDCEVVIRGWEPNQEIELQGRPKELIYVIEGDLFKSSDSEKLQIGTKMVTSIDSFCKLSNSNERAITLHLIVK